MGLAAAGAVPAARRLEGELARRRRAVAGDLRHPGSRVVGPSAGRRTTKVVPSPTRLCTEMLPPWFFTMRWQMASPRPVPFCLVV